MQRKLFGLLSVLSILVVLPAVADATVKCESTDGRYRECGVGAADSVRVLRQLSDNECRRGTSWGYLNGRIWVDNGCRAEFVVSPVNVAISDRDDIIICESVNGRRKHCAADTRGGVILTRRLSDSACDFKNDWDYDKNGVWVRHGCRAEFNVRNAAFVTTSSPPPLPMGQTMLVCESKNGRRMHCPADTRYGASLYRQNSESGCIFNSTWGFDSKGVWVTSGCRGEFAVNTLVPQTVVIQQPPQIVIQSPPQIVVTTPAAGLVKCESINNGFERCSADTRFGASLARQFSDNMCVFNSTWGFDSNGIWVKNGCRGEFAVNTLIPQTSASVSATATSSLVRCESKNNGRNMCPADTRFGVAVYRQLSDNNCVLNSTWGFDSKGVWVNGGCRADFVLNP
ncbi:MAG TPA: DUF3011 domain-containing protein [Thermoanaerobaculia bacterium]|nr:DUF3011 domain-containing protein [Thermoanaerobaculia bacterium]